MIDKHSLTSDIPVPAFCRTAFEKIILSLPVGVHPVADPLFVNRPHAVGFSLLNHYRLCNSQKFPLKGIIIWRCAAVVVIATSVHDACDAPHAGAESVFVIIGIIEVGKSQSVGIFMAECPYAGNVISYFAAVYGSGQFAAA